MNSIGDSSDSDLLFNLRIDPKPIPRSELIEKPGWMETFHNSRMKDRIKWSSKFHKLDKRLLDKSIFDQAEELIDLATVDFSEWVNSLSSDSKLNLTKEYIKELFPIGLDDDSTKGLSIDPKLIKAVPTQLCNILNMPEASIEWNVERIMKLDIEESKKEPRLIAFGKTLPVDMRQPKLSLEVVDIKPNFPDELKSKKPLFKGITHIRSTKTFVQHVMDHPEIPKPRYLVEEKLFEPIDAEKASKHIPLYEYFVTDL